MKDKEKKIDKALKKDRDFFSYSYQCPIKFIIEESSENNFISKQKIIWSFLQDEHDDDISESSDEKINVWKLNLTKELVEEG